MLQTCCRHVAGACLCKHVHVHVTCVVFVLQVLGEQGKAGFYSGRIAEAVVNCVCSHGGVMTTADLLDHHSTFDTPIKTDYRSVDVWEMPPNGQGITALLALNILHGFDFKGVAQSSTNHTHFHAFYICDLAPQAFRE